MRFQLMAIPAALVVAQLAVAAEPRITQTAFCITRTESGGCGEVALAGTIVDFSRLQKRADGTRIVSFFSIQSTEPNAVFVHVLEAEDAPTKLETAVVPANGPKLNELAKPLAALGAKFKDAGYVLLTPFRTDKQDAPYRVFSEIPVRGPGEYHASVTDITGKPLPGGERVTFSVSRGQ